MSVIFWVKITVDHDLQISGIPLWIMYRMVHYVKYFYSKRRAFVASVAHFVEKHNSAQ